MARAKRSFAGVTTARLEDGTLQCKKCKRFLARLDDGVLTVGGIHIWNEARFSCVGCGKVYRYGEEVADRASADESVTLDVMHGLGRDFKPESIVRRERERARQEALLNLEDDC
jgi:RNase P subunit RPR2